MIRLSPQHLHLLDQYNYMSCGRGYLARNLGKRKVYLHWDVVGVPPHGYCVDHINHDILDNRVSNLRIVPHSMNHLNKKGIAYPLAWDKQRGKWKIQVRFKSRRLTVKAVKLLRELQLEDASKP